MPQKSKSKKDELIQIRKYLIYVMTRVSWLKADECHCSINQSRVYTGLQSAIDEYWGTHKLYKKYVFGKISSKDVANFIGETDRNTFRYLKRQRDCLVRFIKEKEDELFTAYPFSDDLVYLRRKDAVRRAK